MEIPVWAILLATAWKLTNETITIVLNHKAKMKELEVPKTDK